MEVRAEALQHFRDAGKPDAGQRPDRSRPVAGRRFAVIGAGARGVQGHPLAVHVGFKIHVAEFVGIAGIAFNGDEPGGESDVAEQRRKKDAVDIGAIAAAGFEHYARRLESLQAVAHAQHVPGIAHPALHAVVNRPRFRVFIVFGNAAKQLARRAMHQRVGNAFLDKLPNQADGLLSSAQAFLQRNVARFPFPHASDIEHRLRWSMEWVIHVKAILC